MKDVLDHLRNYWKVYCFLLGLTAAVYLTGYLVGGFKHSSGIGWALVTDGLLMIVIILLQQGRGGGLVGALGGAGGQSAFGARTGDAMTGITVVLAVLWVLLAGFGGIALRAERGQRHFEAPNLRIRPQISFREPGHFSRPVTVPIRLSRAVEEEIVVTFSIGGPAKRGTDYLLDETMGEGVKLIEVLKDGNILSDKRTIVLGDLLDEEFNDCQLTFTLTFPIGETRRTVSILIRGNDDPEPNRTLTVTIVSVESDAAVVPIPASTTITIVDDDGGPIPGFGIGPGLGDVPKKKADKKADKKAGKKADGKPVEKAVKPAAKAAKKGTPKESPKGKPSDPVPKTQPGKKATSGKPSVKK